MTQRATTFIACTPLSLHRTRPHRHARAPRATPRHNIARTTRVTSSSAADTSVAATATSAPPRITALGANSLLLSHANTTLLIDPWLRDELVFLHPLFFRAQRTAAAAAVSAARAAQLRDVSAVVLTQSLPDHAHVPTLRALPRDKPIIAPPSAAKLLRQLRFSRIFTLPIGQHVSPLRDASSLTIHALRGASVGPPWSTPENAYVFLFGDKFGVYHEPHGTFCESQLRAFAGRVHAVMAPVKRASLRAVGGEYVLVNGSAAVVRACDTVGARCCVLFNNADGRYSGVLPTLLATEGDAQQVRTEVARRKQQQLAELRVVYTERVGHSYAL